jgi:hypothetical protein
MQCDVLKYLARLGKVKWSLEMRGMLRLYVEGKGPVLLAVAELSQVG